MQNFSDPVQRQRIKIWGQMEGVEKMCVFNRKSVVSQKRWEIGLRPRLLLI